MADKKINGITIAINADTKGVTNGLQDLTDKSVSLSKQLKTVESLLKMDPGNTELLATKQDVFAKSVETTKKKLEALKAAQEDVKKAVESGDIGTEQYVLFQKELVMTEKRLKELEKQSTDTGEEVSDLGKETKETGNEMEKTEKQSGKLGETLKDGLAAGAKVAAAGIAALTAAAAAAVAGLVNAAGAAAEYGDNIDKMSQKLGMSSDAYQEWDFIMQHAGSDVDKMTTSMKKLADAVQEPTKESTAAFEKLGISIEDAAKMSQEDLFATTISKLQELESGTERTALANDLLGKSAMDLGALLNMSASETEKMRKQVHDLGGVMSEGAVSTAAKYKDSLQNVKTAIGGVTRSIGASFMPSIIEMMDAVSEIAAGNLDAMDELENGLDHFLSNLERNADKIAKEAETFIPIIINALARSMPQMMQSGLKIIETLANALLNNLPLIIDTGGKILLELSKSLIKELPRVVKIGLDIITQLAKGIADALPTMIPDIIAVVTEIVDILTDPKQLNALIDAAFEIIDALIDGLLNEDSINAMIERVPEVVAKVVEILITSVDKLIDAAVKIISALCDYFMNPDNQEKIKSAAGDILTALGKGLVDLVSNLYGSITTLMSDIMAKMVGEFDADATAGEILAKLEGAWLRLVGNAVTFKWAQDIGSGIASKLFGGDTPEMAVGGIVTAPTRALIGENGPEAVLPLENNTGWMDILAQKINGAGGAGLTIGSINVTVSGAAGIDNVGGVIVQKIDEALSTYQMQQNRGIGGVY